jgi:hypothetical protein
MHPPAASADTIAMTVGAGALHRLIGRRRVVAGSARVQPCECDMYVSLRAQATHCLNAETKSRILAPGMALPRAARPIRGERVLRSRRFQNRQTLPHPPWTPADELDGEGHPIRGWCFMPEGGLALAMGDVMLAQKIAIETDEECATTAATPFLGS